jgi:prevent-host-death family protein
MRANVGVRELKNQTSAVLRRARHGETITVTDRGLPVALLMPVAGPAVQRASAQDAHRLEALVAAGRLSWSGGKPRGLPGGPRVAGASVSDAAIEDRR